MRQHVFVLGLLALGIVALLTFLLLDFSGQPEDLNGQTPKPGLGVIESGDAALEFLASKKEEARTEVREVVPADLVGNLAASEPAAADRPRFELVGRIVDEEGRPLQGERVQLVIFQGGSLDEGVERLEPLGNERVTHRFNGIEVSSGEDGGFELTGALPSKESTMLKIGGDRFHNSATFYLGGSLQQSLPALKVGRRDLGEIRLARTGAIYGRVLNEAGAPVAGTQVWTGPGDGTTFERATVTGDDGRYVLPHARIGTYWVNTVFEGYLTQSAEDIEVQAGRDTGPVDFVLQDSPKIQGRVVDGDGRGIEDARLVGWPVKSGAGRAASAYSDPDGRFTMYLPNEAPYTLEAAHPDFLSWGDDSDRTRSYPPGTEDLLLTMERAVKVRFLVVDDATGEAIDQFGFHVHKGEGSGGSSNGVTERRRPRVTEKPGGEHRAAVRALEDLVMIYADDYLFFVGDVDPTEESVAAGTPEQIVRLKRGATLTGRFIAQGSAVESAEVAFVKGRRSGDEFWPDQNTRQRTTTGEDGRFELRGLQESFWNRLTLSPAAGAASILPDLKVVEGKVLDLGDIEAVVGGSVVGRLVAPSGIDVGGITVYLGPTRDELTQTTDSAGGFRFGAVTPGKWNLTADGKPGVLSAGGLGVCTVESGETASVEIDLTRQAMVPVELTIDLGGLPTEGVEARFLDPNTNRTNRFNSDLALGPADADGVATGFVRAVGSAGLLVFVPGLGQIDHPSARIQLDYGSAIQQTVRFELTAVRITLPESEDLPERGNLEVRLNPAGGSQSDGLDTVQVIRLPIVDGMIAVSSAGFYVHEGNEHVVRGLRTGSYRLKISCIEKGAEMVVIDLGGGRTRFQPKSSFEFERNVALQAGEELRIDLR